MTPFGKRDDRRSEPRRPSNMAGVVVGDRLEMGCAVVDVSTKGMRIRLQRDVALPKQLVVVEIATGLAHEAELAWKKGHEAGLKIQESRSVKGLAPQRLTAAREAWLRAGGR
jgi:hypothetical protein